MVRLTKPRFAVLNALRGGNLETLESLLPAMDLPADFSRAEYQRTFQVLNALTKAGLVAREHSQYHGRTTYAITSAGRERLAEFDAKISAARQRLFAFTGSLEKNSSQSKSSTPLQDGESPEDVVVCPECSDTLPLAYARRELKRFKEVVCHRCQAVLTDLVEAADG